MTRTRRSGPFDDRDHAGAVLARLVATHVEAPSRPLVVALPRGGVQVALPVAEALDASVEIVVVRKVGAPHLPELAIGAVDEDGELLLDGERLDRLRLGPSVIRAQVRSAAAQLRRRTAELRGERAMLPPNGRDIVLVDDGYATGMTARCAARYLARHGARRVILAVPVGPVELREDPPAEFDLIVCPFAPVPFDAVSIHYRSFPEVTDVQVRDMLADSGRFAGAVRSPQVHRHGSGN